MNIELIKGQNGHDIEKFLKELIIDIKSKKMSKVNSLKIERDDAGFNVSIHYDTNLLTPDELTTLLTKYESFNYSPNCWNRGQAIFKSLYYLRPEIAYIFRSTEVDPYYNEEKIPAFIKAICSPEAYATLDEQYK